MWRHCCGWKGETSEIEIERREGIVCGASCPQCGGEWPFLFDEGYPPEDDEEEEEWTPRTRDKSKPKGR